MKTSGFHCLASSHPFFDFFLTLIIASLSSVNASVNFFIYLPRLSNHPLLLFSTISTFYVIGVKCFSNLKFTVSHFSSVSYSVGFFFFLEEDGGVVRNTGIAKFVKIHNSVS